MAAGILVKSLRRFLRNRPVCRLERDCTSRGRTRRGYRRHLQRRRINKREPKAMARQRRRLTRLPLSMCSLQQASFIY